MSNLCYVLLILLAVLIIKLYYEGSLLINNNKNYDMDSDSNYDMDSDPNFQKILQQIKNDTDSKINAAVEEGFSNGYKDMLEQDKNYSNSNSNKHGALVMLFYKKDCHFCQEFMPTWNRIVNNLSNNIKYEEIECNENIKKGVPTIILMVNNTKKTYMGDRSYNDINRFMSSNGVNLVERTFEQFDTTGYYYSPEPTLIKYSKCPPVTFDKHADLLNDTYMFQIFDTIGQYGYATGHTKEGSLLSPFTAAYSVVDSYLSSLPDINNANTCASLYANQIRNFDLCDNNKLNEILQYDTKIKNGTGNIQFEGTDYSSNNIVVNAIKNVCACKS